MDALLGVAAGIVVDDCWLTTINNLQITTKVLIPDKLHLRMDLWPKMSFKPIRHSKICGNIAFSSRNEIVRFCKTKRKGCFDN